MALVKKKRMEMLGPGHGKESEAETARTILQRYRSIHDRIVESFCKGKNYKI
jgi:hypothetical protein